MLHGAMLLLVVATAIPLPSAFVLLTAIITGIDLRTGKSQSRFGAHERRLCD